MNVVEIEIPDATVRRRPRPPADVPTDQLNLRVPITDINAFVAWCEDRGFRQRDGFCELVDTVCRRELAEHNEEWLEPTVRLTIDIPKSLHKRLKQGAMDREETIADVIRALVAAKFPAP